MTFFPGVAVTILNLCFLIFFGRLSYLAAGEVWPRISERLIYWKRYWVGFTYWDKGGYPLAYIKPLRRFKAQSK